MTKSMYKNPGLFQWDAKVAATRPGKPREVVLMTVFSDTRDDAVKDACEAVEAHGFIHPCVHHITRIRP